MLVRIDVAASRLLARVDNRTEETKILGMKPNYGITTDLPSVVLIGGRRGRRLHASPHCAKPGDWRDTLSPCPQA